MKKNTILILVILLINVVCIISYSELSSHMNVLGDAVLRTQYDLRVSYFDVYSSTNSAYATSSSYTNDSISANLSFPIAGSITYKVKITDKTEKYFTLNSVTVTNPNSNISYSMPDFKVSSVYQGVFEFFITFTSSKDNQNANISLKFNMSLIPQQVWNFGYDGSPKPFTASYNAKYKLEVWGASGNVKDALNLRMGYGGYSRGNVSLTAGSVIYVVVGGVGSSSIGSSGNFAKANGGYNGGGYGKDFTDGRGAGGGGGATHIATTSALLKNLSGQKGSYSSSRKTYDSSVILIVAGGGGGVGNHGGKFSSVDMVAGSGGGAVGGTGYCPYASNPSQYFSGHGGSQTAGGAYEPPADYTRGCANYCGGDASFGMGSDCSVGAEGNCSGGGGGFFGGSFNVNYSGAAGGGSGYIGSHLLTDKIMYGFDVDEVDDVEIRTKNTTVFSTTALENTAKVGDGYAKISIVPENN